MTSASSADATITDTAATAVSGHAASSLLVCLPPLPPEVLDSMLANLSQAFAGEELLVATSDPVPKQQQRLGMKIVATSSKRMNAGWVLEAEDYDLAAGLSSEYEAQTVLLLGGSSTALSAEALYSLVDCIRSRQIDLAVPRFSLDVSNGLVNAALLYPLTRALFATNIRFPLPADAACSARMIQRLSASRQSGRAASSSPLLWPVAEASSAGYSVREVEAGDASPPRPQEGEFNALFQSVAASLFTDIEAKASYWQRFRNRSALTADKIPLSADHAPIPAETGSEIGDMIDAFLLAQANLQEIWSLVLPPQSRLALKKLSLGPAESFAFDPHLWARVVYDFTLAFHLRTLNRGHLLGAMMPLYLAWAASHLLAANNDPARAERHIETTAACFELEKSYLVSRWRWPDRFNP